MAKYKMVAVNEIVYTKLKEVQDKLNNDPEDPRFYSMGDIIWDMYKITDDVLRNN